MANAGHCKFALRILYYNQAMKESGNLLPKTHGCTATTTSCFWMLLNMSATSLHLSCCDGKGFSVMIHLSNCTKNKWVFNNLISHIQSLLCGCSGLVAMPGHPIKMPGWAQGACQRGSGLLAARQVWGLHEKDRKKDGVSTWLGAKSSCFDSNKGGGPVSLRQFDHDLAQVHLRQFEFPNRISNIFSVRL